MLAPGRLLASVALSVGLGSMLSTSHLVQRGGARCRRSTLARWQPSSRSFRPLSDSRAAACVHPAREIHRSNRRFNHYVPTAAKLGRWLRTRDHWGRTPIGVNPYYRYVTGDFRGTTDEIIQWAAAKWGIPVDWLRAQYAHESIWRQRSCGDTRYVGPAWYRRYPAQARLPHGYVVCESMGLSQVKWLPDGTTGAGTEPLRWESTAFNADYQAATVRFYFDDPGHRRSHWGDRGYRPGETWESLAGWYDPYPWHNAGQQWYIGLIEAQLRAHSWLKRYF